MKKIIHLCLILFTFAFAINVKSQIPSYTLEANNFDLSPDLKKVTFDIVLTHTNSNLFEYAGGQYFFKVPQAFGDIGVGSGTSSGFQYDSAAGSFISDFSSTMIPRNPSVVTTTINGVPSYELRLAGNSLPGTGNGTVLPQGVPWLVIKMKIIVNTGVINYNSNCLQIRDSCSDIPLSVTRTKINAYVANLNTEITRCANQSVDCLLPVELASFTSVINRRDVTLNWTTSSEVNNHGYDIERSNVRGQKSEEWNKISFISGNGTVNSPKDYSFIDRNLSSGKYNYRLKQIDNNGNFEYFNLSNEVIVGVPEKFDLSQNFPNPFNPSTKINYDLPFDSKVSIKLFDMSGREVTTLVNEVKPAGYYTINFNASNLASGVYFYRINADANGKNFVLAKKMLLLK